ncbi:two-component sensor histidine kinase [Mangrovactinospora gilvigrisea]|uniref:histidine kinase n=1 Tax=Mangrovactinospora gilvigrisea TaxID=1428644 RepID=A0A1J7BYM4_9ACTN|nr:HAMP domain-containing sensor histidine kinase [Mangrovactinospora gilvigrisea]OIV38569.1 two-component sensor histidine kinase [Mangrovactinospora gilvigrisea]
MTAAPPPGPSEAPSAPGRLRRALRRVRLGSLRVRLIAVFGLVALVAACSASGIAYWLNRDALLKRTEQSVVDDFRKSLKENVGAMPANPDCSQLGWAAKQINAGTALGYQVVLHTPSCSTPAADASDGASGSGSSAGASPDGSRTTGFTYPDVPAGLIDAVGHKRSVDAANAWAYHMYWQRITVGGAPYLVVGTRVESSSVTGYAFKSLRAESEDLSSLAWSLGIATTLALIAAALLAQASSTMVLRPMQRLGDAARRLGRGEFDARLPVRGTDELADLARTFNVTAESLQGRVQELKDREESSRRFVADMSHELRTPLTAITAVTELLEDEVQALEPGLGQAVELVVSETRRLNDLVENLMEVTRLDAGTARLVLDDVDVADQVTSCIDTRAWLDAVQLHAARGIEARLDPRRLDVILANLIGNALKHGGSPVRVAVRRETAARAAHSGERARLERPGPLTVVSTNTAEYPAGTELLIIEVADSGPGIPDAVLPHVFDRFYKADSGRVRSAGLGGSGLGLSIALENARIHGGELSATNSAADGEGAVFTLTLPLRPVAAPADGPEPGSTTPEEAPQ